ncbi:hypothetical protein BN1723_015543 [Verticillium longisporum]|uniref:Uncharacterized protein n=1 Tax=Verticillium longisporum TaxID=100787 RepID=A0A0G4MZE9_VERLO|nr:hypothetical protein BN1723_015543 [Verticillium longisporum]
MASVAHPDALVETSSKDDGMRFTRVVPLVGGQGSEKKGGARQQATLKSIDITVKNCCRPVPVFHESGSGIQDTGFIDAFELLVVQGIRALQKLRSVDYLRIRFVDLDSLLPPLNP